MRQENLLIWLPNPMGDAILCTPAMRAIREYKPDANITYIAKKIVRELLEPCPFCDHWLESDNKNVFEIANELRKQNFDYAILFKNSFASALAVFLAGIKNRIGYSRDKRGFLLTEKLHPPRSLDGGYMPISMIDYYLAIASWLGAYINNRNLQLATQAKDYASLKIKLPEVVDSLGPLIVLVPGGAFGLSKCWLSERFADTADWLAENHKARIIVSVAPSEEEKEIARQICKKARNELINLATRSLTIGELKALFSITDLVICNDTGPRHIAIALGRKVITLFGPNDPAWTQTGHSQEVQIIGKAPCVPCLKPKCRQSSHLCMESISVERVCQAAQTLLRGKTAFELSDTRQNFTQIAQSFFVDEDYKEDFEKLRLTSIDSVFEFEGSKNLTKKNLAPYRNRIEFDIGIPPKTFFLKRYNNPPLSIQIKNWLTRYQRVSCGLFDLEPTKRLTACGLKTAKIVAYGQQWHGLFEKRSFLITEKVPNAVSLEQKLPDCFYSKPTESISPRKESISAFANFIREFHLTGLRHRDLYLCHIFYDGRGNFTLIDMARTFEPLFSGQRYLLKDITQLYYSASGKYITKTDKLRFYLSYVERKNLSKKDKKFISQIINKAGRMAKHDIKHGRNIPFEG